MEVSADVRLIGQLIGLFSYDIGYEIDLGRVRALIAEGEPGGLERRRPAPAHLTYTTPPLHVPLGAHPVPLGEAMVDAAAHARLHDIGAVTIVLQAPLACEVQALPTLTTTLTGAGPLEDVARRLLEQLYQRILPAIAKPSLNAFVEDYYVLQVDRFEPRSTPAALLAQERATVASALRCDTATLCDTEVTDVFRTQLCYTPDDLVVTEWNVALVVDDTDYADTVNVLEYLNVQLVELRFYDEILDRRIQGAYGLSGGRAPALPLLNRPFRRAVDELADMRIDVTTLVERLNNALKLSGDLYLAKLYTRTAERLGLRAWADSVSRKLDVLHQLYNVLVERSATARGEALEVTIIVLIALEIALFLAGWG